MEIYYGIDGAVVTNTRRQEDSRYYRWRRRTLIAWVDYRFDGGDIFLQHVDSNGEILLDSNGVALAQAMESRSQLMCTDSIGGFITWQDKRSGVTMISMEHTFHLIIQLRHQTGVPIIEGETKMPNNRIRW